MRGDVGEEIAFSVKLLALSRIVGEIVEI